MVRYLIRNYVNGYYDFDSATSSIYYGQYTYGGPADAIL